MPRGEVGLIVAGIGERTGVFDERTFSAAALMCVLTVILVPPLLRMLTRGREMGSRKEEPVSMRGERDGESAGVFSDH